MKTKRNKRPLFYLVRHVDADGYTQNFSRIETLRDVRIWARDGSIGPGDPVYAVYEENEIRVPRRKQA